CDRWAHTAVKWPFASGLKKSFGFDGRAFLFKIPQISLFAAFSLKFLSFLVFF
ncbi:hypothetical protein ACJX0J_040918, partial [Zea mays]